MPQEDDGYQYIPFPIEYMDEEEASKYQATLRTRKEAEAMREGAHTEYLTAMERANAIREQDELEYFTIKRDAKTALKKEEGLYLPIIKSSEDLINKVNPDSVVRPVIVDAEQHAASLRKKMDGAPPSKNAQKMVDKLTQLIKQSPETALDQFVDQMDGLNPVERKTIKAALELDCNFLKTELAKGTFSLERRMNVPFFKARIGNLIDKISTPEYTKQEELELGQQAQYANRLQNKMESVLADGQTPALKRQASKSAQKGVVSAAEEAPLPRHDIKEVEKVKSAPPGLDPNYKHISSYSESLRGSLVEGSTSGESISIPSVKSSSKGRSVSL